MNQWVWISTYSMFLSASISASLQAIIYVSEFKGILHNNMHNAKKNKKQISVISSGFFSSRWTRALCQTVTYLWVAEARWSERDFMVSPNKWYHKNLNYYVLNRDSTFSCSLISHSRTFGNMKISRNYVNCTGVSYFTLLLLFILAS